MALLITSTHLVASGDEAAGAMELGAAFIFAGSPPTTGAGTASSSSASANAARLLTALLRAGAGVTTVAVSRGEAAEGEAAGGRGIGAAGWDGGGGGGGLERFAAMMSLSVRAFALLLLFASAPLLTLRGAPPSPFAAGGDGTGIRSVAGFAVTLEEAAINFASSPPTAAGDEGGMPPTTPALFLTSSAIRRWSSRTVSRCGDSGELGERGEKGLGVSIIIAIAVCCCSFPLPLLLVLLLLVLLALEADNGDADDDAAAKVALRASSTNSWSD